MRNMFVKLDVSSRADVARAVERADKAAQLAQGSSGSTYVFDEDP
jgi:hypothetical protein